MKKRTLIALLAAASLVLGGCSTVHEVENQAYALVMGLDTRADGGLELSIRVPRIGTSKEDSGAGVAAGDYLAYAVEGGSFDEALESLRLAVPRELNLSHVKLLIVSASLAGEAQFSGIIDRIAETPHLNTRARLIICEGRAKDVINAQKTIIGTRLSTEIEAEFEHYAERGYVPDTTFADVYFNTHSFYSDPTAIWCYTDRDTQSAPVSARAGIVYGKDAVSEAPTQAFYAGAALFREGVLVGRLDARQALLLNLALGRRVRFQYEYGDRVYRLASEGSAQRRVIADGGAARVELTLKLTSQDAVAPGDAAGIERALEASIARLIELCQGWRVEPFGFAERAASRFLTVPEWKAFDWRGRFAAAETAVNVTLKGTDN